MKNRVFSFLKLYFQSARLWEDIHFWFKKIWLGRYWLWGYRFKQIVLTILTTSVAATFLTFMIGICLPFMSKLPALKLWIQQSGDLNSAVIYLGILVLLLLILFGISYFCFWRLPPSEYSKISLSGVSATYMIMLSSFEAYKICYNFIKDPRTRFLMEMARKNQSNPQEIKKKEKKIQVAIEGIQEIIGWQARKLQIVYEMKLLTSEYLSVQTRRLCDYVLEFSPKIYSHRVKKFHSNWSELVQLIQVLDEDNNSEGEIQHRVEALYSSINRIYNGIEKQTNNQVILLQQEDLLGFVHDISAELSSSSSVKHYAEAISHICWRFLKKDYWITQQDNKEKSNLENRLRFIYRKRQGYPGFDIHRALHNFLTTVTVMEDKITWALAAKTALESISKKKEITPGLDNHDFRALSKLFIEFEKGVEKNRLGIVGEFILLFEELFKDTPPEQRVIVTHNFSKNVRQIIKKGLTELNQRNQLARSFSSKTEHFGVTVFLLNEDNDLNRESFKTRLFHYELTEDESFQRTLKNSNIRLTSGSYDLLEGILKPDSKVCLLLGGECFDYQRRVLHVAGVSKKLKKLRLAIEEIIGGNNFHTVVVGEEFKLYVDLLKEPALMLDHLESIDFYDPEDIDLIIYGEGKRIIK